MTRLRKKIFNIVPLLIAGAILLCLTVVGSLLYNHLTLENETLTYNQQQKLDLKSKMNVLSKQHDDLVVAYQTIKNEDQYVKNVNLESEIAAIHATYISAIKTYEGLIKLRESQPKTEKLDKELTKALLYLSDKNYASAEAALAKLNKDIDTEQQKISSTFAIPGNVKTQNAPPGAGYSRQRVQTPVGDYLVDVIAADLNGTRVIVDTASDSTCGNDCPVDALGSYAARSGGFAGINGPYFCPASYPSCAGKTNSFDTLLMNKNKVYFNSDNNVYSNVPAVIFSGNAARFVGQSQEWGRDTGVDAVIAAQPMLMLNGQRVFGGDGEPKRSGKGSRSFIGATGTTVYIGVIHNVSTAEMAYVLETMGIASALNLDSGGSTALWSGGRYIVGPGRNTPFGILLVRR